MKIEYQRIYHFSATQLVWCIALFLSACQMVSGISELQLWMENIRKETKVFVQPLQAPKTLVPFVYSEKTELDPFDIKKFSVDLSRMLAQRDHGSGPNVNRPKDPLESYPLDIIQMVGTLQKKGVYYAVLQVHGMIFSAKAGNYIGQNFGLITHIHDREITVMEKVRDAAGQWVERETTLTLQEDSK